MHQKQNEYMRECFSLSRSGLMPQSKRRSGLMQKLAQNRRKKYLYSVRYSALKWASENVTHKQK